MVAGGLLIILGVLSAAAFPKILKRSKEIWTETDGRITEPHVHTGKSTSTRRKGSTHRRSSSKNTYQVMIRYAYEAGGGVQTGNLPALNQPEDYEKYDQAKAVMETYKAGDAIKVYYNPAEPERSRFTPKEPDIEFWLDMLFTSFYLVGGALAIFLARKALALNPRPPPPSIR